VDRILPYDEREANGGNRERRDREDARMGERMRKRERQSDRGKRERERERERGGETKCAMMR